MSTTCHSLIKTYVKLQGTPRVKRDIWHVAAVHDGKVYLFVTIDGRKIVELYVSKDGIYFENM